MSYTIPLDRHYDGERHLWAHATEGARVVVGVDALGLESLGDLAYVKLAEPGTPVKRGDSIGTLEAAKMTSPVVAPASGVIAARNDAALRDPSIVNRDPYGDGWLVAIDATDWTADADHLVHGDAIAPWVEAEVARYRAEGWLE